MRPLDAALVKWLQAEEGAGVVSKSIVISKVSWLARLE